MNDPYAPLVELYDIEHDDFTEDLDWVLEKVNDGPVLDIGCGSGRLAQALVDAGIPTTGIDVSGPMLERARKRPGSKSPIYTEGDIRTTKVDGSFELAMFTLNGFAHLTDADGQIAALTNIRASLSKKGLLVLDLANPDPSTWLREDSLVVLAWTKEEDGRFYRKTYSRSINEAIQTQTLQIWYDSWTNGGPVNRYASELALRYFYPAELEHILARAGFEIEELLGDYDESPYDAFSERLIVLARPLATGRK